MQATTENWLACTIGTDGAGTRGMPAASLNSAGSRIRGSGPSTPGSAKLPIRAPQPLQRQVHRADRLLIFESRDRSELHNALPVSCVREIVAAVLKHESHGAHVPAVAVRVDRRLRHHPRQPPMSRDRRKEKWRPARFESRPPRVSEAGDSPSRMHRGTLTLYAASPR